MKHLIFALSAALILFSCGQKKDKKTDDSKGKDTVQQPVDTNTVVTKDKEAEPTIQNSNPTGDPYLITGNSVGLVMVHMPLAAMKEAVKPPQTFGKRIPDFEGDTLYPVNEGKRLLYTMRVYYEKVTEIVVSDTGLHTADGVKVGMLLSDLEKKYGKITSIDIDEQDDFEYTRFASHPGMTFRVTVKQKGKRAGTYAKDEFTSKTYSPDAFVSAIEIHEPY